MGGNAFRRRHVIKCGMIVRVHVIGTGDCDGRGGEGAQVAAAVVKVRGAKPTNLVLLWPRTPITSFQKLCFALDSAKHWFTS